MVMVITEQGKRRGLPGCLYYCHDDHLVYSGKREEALRANHYLGTNGLDTLLGSMVQLYGKGLHSQ